MNPRSVRPFAAASAVVLGLVLAGPVSAAHDPRGAAPLDISLQQATSTPTPTASPGRGPDGRGPENRGPENAPGRPSGTPSGSATAGATSATGRERAKTPPTLPANASERARTVVKAVFERNAQVRDLIAQMRAARGLPPVGGDADVTDDFAKNAKQKQSGDTVVDPKALTAEQREQFQTQLRDIMAAFAETLRQSAGTVTDGTTTASPTPTPTSTSTATATPTATRTP